MRDKSKLLLLSGATIVFIVLYLFHELNGSYHYALPRRAVKVVAMGLTAVAIAYATVVFQTITQNRILTPSVMGLDSLYVMIQTVIYYFFGSMSVFVLNKYVNFSVAMIGMVVMSLLLYTLLLKEGKRPIYFLLLVGIIVGTFLGSVTTFMQVLIDPNEFLTLQNKLFASFNNVNADLVWFALALVVITILYSSRYTGKLDVMLLGRDNAINLGVAYDHVVKKMLIVSTVLIATSTALVGPITFFGLIVSNLAYQYFRSYKHSIILIGSSLLGVIALVGGQWAVEHVFNFGTTLSVIINFVGGVYFIYLLLKESKAK